MNTSPRKPGREGWLSEDDIEALHADLRVRIELQRLMAEHTSPVLELELGVSPVTIWYIVNGEYYTQDNHRVPVEVVNEIRRRRAIWALTRERYQDYTKPALCEKYGVSQTAMHRHMHIVRGEDRRMAA